MNKFLPGLPLAALLIASCSEQSSRYPGPLTVEDALAKFHLDERFEIESFVSEPQIMDPVDLVFDEWGAAYVVEMPDYPHKQPPGQGRIRKLIDQNGDGNIDEVHLFADSLLDATSVLPWKGGLIVTAAPHIFYLKDTDGDHRADSREILFSGFFENNSEAQITNLRYGLDNWIYANNRGQPGTITYQGKPGSAPLNVAGADFRFRLDRDTFALETGAGQFGQALSEWNHRFVTENTIHIQQSVIPRRYLSRHEYMPSLRAMTEISDHGLRMYQLTPAPYWRQERSRRRQEQYDAQGLDRIEHVDGHFTGASGGTYYGSTVFPEEFHGNIFTAEVAGNLFHRDVLVPDPERPHFQARRAEEEKEREFLASEDMWFRPVGSTVGPDGYLYLIDMYRQHIETPLSIPEDLMEDMDFDAGKEHGRIYRIKPKGHERPKLEIRLGESSTEELVAYLAHDDQWWRIQAQRLLIERQDKSVVEAIRKLLQHEKPVARAHALHALDGLQALRQEDVAQALKDPEAPVREQALMLAENYPELVHEMKRLAADENPRVALQAALSIGSFPARHAGSTLAAVLENRGADQWFRMAVLSSPVAASAVFLQELIARGTYFGGTEQGQAAFLQDLAYVIGARNDAAEVVEFIGIVKSEKLPNADAMQGPAAQGLGRGLQAAAKQDKAIDARVREALGNWAEEAAGPLKESLGKTLDGLAQK